MLWAVPLVTIAISEVHFSSMRRGGLCRDLCEWQNARGTDGELQAGAQRRRKLGGHKVEVTLLEQIGKSSITESSPGNGNCSVGRSASSTLTRATGRAAAE